MHRQLKRSSKVSFKDAVSESLYAAQLRNVPPTTQQWKLSFVFRRFSHWTNVRGTKPQMRSYCHVSFFRRNVQSRKGYSVSYRVPWSSSFLQSIDTGINKACKDAPSALQGWIDESWHTLDIGHKLMSYIVKPRAHTRPQSIHAVTASPWDT